MKPTSLYASDKELAQFTGLSRSHYQKSRVSGSRYPFVTLTPTKRAYPWLNVLLTLFPPEPRLVDQPAAKPAEGRWGTAKDVAALTGLSPSWVEKRQRINSPLHGFGPIGRRNGTGNRWFYWLPDVDAWVKMFGVYYSTSQEEPDPDPQDHGSANIFYYKWLDDGTYRLKIRKKYVLND